MLVLFPVHALAFAVVGWRKRQPRYLLTIVIFCALTGVMWINFHQLEVPRWRALLRSVALGFTGLSLVAMLRRESPDA